MSRIRAHAPKPAMVGAVTGSLALFISLGGAAGAANLAQTIAGSSIQKHSIPADRLKNDSITGVQIKESKLGKVPSAKVADSAGTAGSAATATTATNAAHATAADSATNATNATNAVNAVNVNGVYESKFFATDAVNTANHTIATYGGATISGACDSSGKPTLKVTLNEQTNNMYVVQDGTGSSGNASTAANSPVTIATGAPVAFGGIGTASFVGYTSHKLTRVDWFVRDSNALGTGTGCFYAGTITVA